jgi:hypothetical protein
LKSNAPKLSNAQSQRPMSFNSKEKKSKYSNLDQITTCKSQMEPKNNHNPRLLSNFEFVINFEGSQINAYTEN